MMQTDDPVLRLRREQAERAAADAEGRRKNLATFERMFLSVAVPAFGRWWLTVDLQPRPTRG